jgi:hypothetical protein
VFVAISAFRFFVDVLVYFASYVTEFLYFVFSFNLFALAFNIILFEICRSYALTS